MIQLINKKDQEQRDGWLALAHFFTDDLQEYKVKSEFFPSHTHAINLSAGMYTERKRERRKRKSSAYIIVGIILLTSIMRSVHFSQNTGQHLFITGNVFKSGKEDIETGPFNRDVSLFPPV